MKKEYKTSILILAILILSFDDEVNNKETFKKYFCQFVRFSCVQAISKAELSEHPSNDYIRLSLLREVMTCYINLISYDCLGSGEYIRVEKHIMDELAVCFTKPNIEAYVSSLLENLKVDGDKASDSSLIQFDEFFDDIFEKHLKDDIILRENLLKIKNNDDIANA